MNRIAVTSGELRETAGRMRTTAGTLQDELGRLMSRVNELTASWQGDAAVAFSTLYAEMHVGMGRVKESLDGIASMLDQSASTYDTTETELANRFRQ